jgi:hypothetical protein
MVGLARIMDTSGPDRSCRAGYVGLMTAEAAVAGILPD